MAALSPIGNTGSPAPSVPDFNLLVSGSIYDQNGNYRPGIDPSTGFPVGQQFQQINDGGFTGFLDNLIKYGSIAGGAAIGGAAGMGYGAGGTGTDLASMWTPVGAGGPSMVDTGFGAGTAFGSASPLTSASVPGSFGGAGGAPLASAGSDLTGMTSALPGASTPGLTGLPDYSLATAPNAAGGLSGSTASLGTGATMPSNFLSGVGAGGSSGMSGLLQSLFTPGGKNSLINMNSMGSLLSSLLGSNRSGQLSGNLTAPYNTAMNNAQPGVNNLLSMMNPNTFYSSPVGQNLMASKIRDLNATASAAGRFGVGQGGNIPASGAGIDAANLLNQYMAQQYSSALNANAGAVSPLLGAVNATYPGYNAGNVIGANSLNPLMSLFNNPAIQNGGNSALQYLWNGIG